MMFDPKMIFQCIIVNLLCWQNFRGARSDWISKILIMEKSENFSFNFYDAEFSELLEHIEVKVPAEKPPKILTVMQEHTLHDIQHLTPHVLQFSQSAKDVDDALHPEGHLDEQDHAFTRSVILQGGVPRAEIEYRSFSTNGIVVPSRRKILKAVTMQDLSKPADNCKSKLCEPVWVVPFLEDGENFVFNVHLHTDGMASLPHQSVKREFLSGFGDSKSFFPSLGSPLDNQTSIYGISENFPSISQFSSVFSIGPIGNDSFNLGSRGNGLVQTLKASDSMDGVDLCNCVSSPTPLKVLSLPDRILIAYKTGVWEVAGNFSVRYVNNKNWSWNERVGQAWRILDVCIKRMYIAPSDFAPRGRNILALGGCQNKDEVYVAHYSARQASPVQFSPLSSASVCNVSLHLQTCYIISACVRAIGLQDFFFLLGDENGSYELIHVHSNGHNESIATEILKPEYPSEEAYHRSNLSDFKISGISSSSSHSLFLWGDAVLVSHDEGESWEVRGNFTGNEIIIFSNLYDSFFYFVTKKQEIWAGERHSTELIKIYPTFSFDFLIGCSFSPDKSHVTALLSDIDRNLEIIYFDKSDNWKVKGCHGKARLDQVLAHIAFMAEWEHETGRTAQASGATPSRPVSNNCPYEFIQMSVVMDGKGSVTQTTQYQYEPPLETADVPQFSQDSLLLYSMTVEDLEHHHSIESSDVGVSKNSIDVWKNIVGVHARYDQYLVWRDQSAHPLYFNSEGYKQVYESDDVEIEVHVSPKELFLDYRQTAAVILHLHVKEPTFDLDSVHVLVDTGVRKNIEVEINKTIEEFRNAVDFQIKIRDIQTVTEQFPPGGNLGLSAVDLNVLPTSLQCEGNSVTDTNQQTHWTLSVITGCPPTSSLIFDHKTSQRYLATVQEAYFDCKVPSAVPCFYFSSSFYPFFAYMDDADGHWKNFTGNYTLTIVGASEKHPEKIKRFADADIVHFNSMLAHPSKNVWGPVDGEANTTKEGFPIYNSQNHFGLGFFCQPESPCANILPSLGSAPEIFLMIEFSNKGVDHSTHCDFTMQFLVRVHGLPINTIRMSLILAVWGIGVQICYILIYLLCHCQLSPSKKSFLTRLKERYTFLQFKKKVEPVLDWRKVVERRMRINKTAERRSVQSRRSSLSRQTEQSQSISITSDQDSLSDGGHFVTRRRGRLRDESNIRVIYDD